MPIVSPAQAKAEWQAYVDLVAAIGTEDDYQSFYDKKSKTTRRFPKKSLCRKLARYFGLDVVIKSEQRVDLGDGHFAFEATATAVAPNGKKQDGDGACTTLEDRFDITPYDDEPPHKFEVRKKKALARAYHDVRGTAITRAKNRATMDLIGAGQVTADEISRDQGAPPEDRRPPARITLPDDLIIEIRATAKALGFDEERLAKGVSHMSEGTTDVLANLLVPQGEKLLAYLKREQAKAEAAKPAPDSDEVLYCPSCGAQRAPKEAVQPHADDCELKGTSDPR
jgi:hypothetical protein